MSPSSFVGLVLRKMEGRCFASPGDPCPLCCVNHHDALPPDPWHLARCVHCVRCVLPSSRQMLSILTKLIHDMPVAHLQLNRGSRRLSVRHTCHARCVASWIAARLCSVPYDHCMWEWCLGDVAHRSFPTSRTFTSVTAWCWLPS